MALRMGSGSSSHRPKAERTDSGKCDQATTISSAVDPGCGRCTLVAHSECTELSGMCLTCVVAACTGKSITSERARVCPDSVLEVSRSCNSASRVRFPPPPPLSAREAIENVSQSHGVVIPLLALNNMCHMFTTFYCTNHCTRSPTSNQNLRQFLVGFDSHIPDQVGKRMLRAQCFQYG